MIASVLLQVQEAGEAVADTLRGQLDRALDAAHVLLEWEVLLPRLVSVAFILVIAFVFYRVLRIIIRRIITREIDEEDPIVKRLRQQRSQTLGSLLASFAAVVVALITLLTVLGLFIDIGPLLASVGVLGLAVSFGAQSLVKDIITGVFMLLEGQFGIGDVVRIGDTSGSVEKITLRTTILRDTYGTLHIIPNGEITRVSNLTKTWSRAVVDVGIAYREDVDRVIGVLRDIGRQLHADPEWNALLVGEPEVPGIEQLGDSAVMLRILVKTLPLKQWDVARELRRRIKVRFDSDGIELPFQQMTIHWANQPPFAGTGDDAMTDSGPALAGRRD